MTTAFFLRLRAALAIMEARLDELLRARGVEPDSPVTPPPKRPSIH